MPVLATKDDGWIFWSVTALVAMATVLSYFLYRTNKRWATNWYITGSGRRRASSGGPTKFHVLIPCHVESQRRLLLFIRCLRSVSLQVCHNLSSGYDVFISVSGPAEYRENALNFLAKIKSTSMSTEPGKIAWHVYDTKKHALPQMEHLRNLVEKSERKDSDASLLFLDNDDMFHPMRLMAFQEA